MNSGAPGKMAVYANYDPDSTNYKGLIQCEVRAPTCALKRTFCHKKHVHVSHSPPMVITSRCRRKQSSTCPVARMKRLNSQNDVIVIGQNERTAFDRKGSETSERAQIEERCADPERPGRTEETGATGAV